MYFHVLKNGCRVEALQLRSIEKIERALVLYMVVAWRIAALTRLRRSCPDMDARIFDAVVAMKYSRQLQAVGGCIRAWSDPPRIR